MMRHFLAAWACTLALAACSGNDAGPSDAGVTEVDSAGVTIVENATPVWPATPRHVVAEPELDLEGEGPEQFGALVFGLLRADGGVVVVDAMSREVRGFDPEGVPTITAGGEGDGPGEFSAVSPPFAYRGDSVAVFDGRLRRTTIISLETGGYRTIANAVEGNFSPFGATGAGDLLFMNWGGGYRPDLEPGLQWDTTDVYRARPDSTWAVISRRASRQQVVLTGGNTDVLIPAQASIQGPTEAGFFWGTTDRYEIRFYDLDGTLRRIVRRPVAPTPVDPAMIDVYVDGMLERVRRFEGEEAVPRYRQRYEAATYGDRVPVFGVAFVDRDDRLWVSENTWPAWDADARRWSVFSPQGRWLGEIEAPERMRILDAMDDRVLGVWRDAFDVPHVRVHRLESLDAG